MEAPFPYPDTDLDEIDVGIMEQLSQDGRRSNAKIAATLGASVYVVKKRVDRLLSKGIIDIVPVVDRERLGFTAQAMLGVAVEPAKAGDVVAQLSAFPEVPWVARTMSRYNVLAEVVLRRPADMFDLVTGRVAAISGVRSTSAYFIYRQFMWIAGSWRESGDQLAGDRSLPRTANRDGSDSGGPPERAVRARLDDLDQIILGLLMADGRRPAAEIARITGVSTSTVTARLDRLIQNGVCNVIGLLNPQSVGFTSHMFVGVHADPMRVAMIGEELRRVPQVLWIGHLSGWYDILLDVWLRDAEELPSFIAEHITTIQGIRATEAFWVEDVDRDRAFDRSFNESMALRRRGRPRAERTRAISPSVLRGV